MLQLSEISQTSVEKFMMSRVSDAPELGAACLHLYYVSFSIWCSCFLFIFSSILHLVFSLFFPFSMMSIFLVTLSPFCHINIVSQIFIYCHIFSFFYLSIYDYSGCLSRSTFLFSVSLAFLFSVSYLVGIYFVHSLTCHSIL